MPPAPGWVQIGQWWHPPDSWLADPIPLHADLERRKAVAEAVGNRAVPWQQAYRRVAVVPGYPGTDRILLELAEGADMGGMVFVVCPSGQWRAATQRERGLWPDDDVVLGEAIISVIQAKWRVGYSRKHDSYLESPSGMPASCSLIVAPLILHHIPIRAIAAVRVGLVLVWTRTLETWTQFHRRVLGTVDRRILPAWIFYRDPQSGEVKATRPMPNPPDIGFYPAYR